MVEAWLNARPTVTVVLREESDWATAVVLKFTFVASDYGYEWRYDFVDNNWTDDLYECVESIVSYMKDTLGVDTDTHGYPQIFEMIFKQKGGLK
jgi:hypothetical protein